MDLVFAIILHQLHIAEKSVIFTIISGVFPETPGIVTEQNLFEIKVEKGKRVMKISYLLC